MSSFDIPRRAVTEDNMPGLRDTLRLVVALFRSYPLRTVSGISLLIAANLAESVGVVMLLPLLASFSGEGDLGTAGIVNAVKTVLTALGITPSALAYLLIIVGGMVTKGVLNFAATTVIGYTNANLMTDLRTRLIGALMRAKWSYFVQQPIGLLTNMLGHEARVAATTYQVSAKFIAEILQVSVYVTLALITSWQIAAGGFVFGLIMFACMRSLIAMTHKASQAQVRHLRALVGYLADGLSSMKPIKAMALERLVGPLLENRAVEIKQAQRREMLSVALLQSVNEPLLAVFLGIGIYVVLVVLARPFAEVLFMAILFQRMVTRIATLQGSYQGLIGSQVTYRALTETTTEAVDAAEVFGGTKRLTEFGEIMLDHVTFAHAGTPVLTNVSMSAPPGKITAIIGPSGAGKTTIVDLVIGLFRPDRGRVSINGVSLNEIDMGWWRSRIGYVPQDTVLFNDTIHQNVTLGDPALSREDTIRALSAAGLDTFIASLRDGIDTNVGERGNRVSGGQRQRLAIARALARKPALLIFDEATTSLDPDTEAGILGTLRGLAGEITVIAISHQPALLDIADNIYRISDGAILPFEVQPPMVAAAEGDQRVQTTL